MRVKHLRKGKFLANVIEDNHYDYDLQQMRTPQSDEKIYPGDELRVECDYDTRKRSNFTFGGLSTRNEMCDAMLVVYPAPKLANCIGWPAIMDEFVESSQGSERVMELLLNDLIDWKNETAVRLYQEHEGLNGLHGQWCSQFGAEEPFYVRFIT